MTYLFSVHGVFTHREREHRKSTMRTFTIKLDNIVQ